MIDDAKASPPARSQLQAQAAAYTLKERVTYVDPEEERYKWAAALRPSHCGKIAKDKELDQWLISVINNYRPPQNRKNNHCTVGGKTLQRVLGHRYGDGTPESGRNIYSSNDIDIWFRTREDQNHFIDYATEEIRKKGVLELVKTTGLDNFGQGLYQSSLKVRRRSTKTKPLSQSTIDTSSPLNPDESPTARAVIDTTKDRLHRFINDATLQTMATVTNKEGKRVHYSLYTLDDTKYLNSLGEALDNPTCSVPIYEKLQNTVCLLLYMEVTRRLWERQEDIDPFCIRLIEIVCAHLPQQHESLKHMMPWLQKHIGHKSGFELLTKLVCVPTAKPRPKKADQAPQPDRPTPLKKEPRESKAIAIVNPVTLKPLDITAIPKTAEAKPPALSLPDVVLDSQPTDATAPKPLKSGLPSWAEITQATPQPVEGRIQQTFAQPSPGKSGVSKKKPPRRDDYKPALKKGKPDKKQSKQSLQSGQHYLPLEQLTAGFLTQVSEKLTGDLSHEEKMGILFDHGIDLELLKEVAEWSIEALALWLLVVPPKPQAPKRVPPELPPLKTDDDILKKKTTTETTVAPIISESPPKPDKGVTHEKKKATSQAKKQEAKERREITQAFAQLDAHLSQEALPPTSPDEPTEREITACLTSYGNTPPTSPLLDNPDLTPVRQLKSQLHSYGALVQTIPCTRDISPIMELPHIVKGGDFYKTVAAPPSKSQSLPDSAYTDYLRGVVYLDNRQDQKGKASQNLLRAATAGVTGAAIALIHNSLCNKQHLVPASAAMALLQHCVERPAHRQYDLRFQFSPCETSCSPEQEILGIIERNLQSPMTATAWTTMGEQLFHTSQSMPDKRERCLLLATCALNFGGSTNKALECRNQMRKSLRSLNLICQFDWVVQGLHPTQNKGQILPQTTPVKLPGLLQEWPPAVALQKVWAQDINGLERAVAELVRQSPEYQEGCWYTWLAFCIPSKMDMSWMQDRQTLRDYWTSLLKRRSIHALQKPCPSLAPQDQPLVKTTSPNPMQAKALLKAMKASAEDVAQDIKKMDTIIAQELARLSSMEFSKQTTDSGNSIIIEGCKKTACALHRLGAKPDEHANPAEVRSFCFDNVPREHRIEGVALLKDVVEHYATPLACWVYGRFIRSELIQLVHTSEGKKAWYENYLSLLLFAAQMGVIGAANDLLAESLAGRADAVLSATALLIARRCSLPLRSKIQLTLPPISRNSLLNDFDTQKHKYDRGVWCKHVLSWLDDLFNSAKSCTNIQQHTRLIWFYSLTYSFLEDNEKTTSISLSVRAEKPLLPSDLQATLVMSLQHFKKVSLPNGKEFLQKFLDPKAQKQLALYNENTPLPALDKQDSKAMLPWMQWQLGSDVAIDQTKKLKVLLSESTSHLAQQVNASEQLMRLIWRTTVMASEVICTDDCREPHLEKAQPWQSTLFFLRHGEMLKASGNLSSQFTKLALIDEALLEELSLCNKPDAYLSPFVMILSGEIVKATGEKTFSLSTLTAIPLMATLIRDSIECLKGPDAANPYPYLIRGLCLEAENGANASDDAIVQASVLLMRAGMLGSDCAVHHLARLAMARKESPVALERVLDMYLLQNRRALRYTVFFDFPSYFICNPEQAAIINTLERICLCHAYNRMSTNRLIESILIPSLLTLELTIEDMTTKSQLNYLISCCYQKIKQAPPKILFDIETVDKLPTSLLHQWRQHLVITKGILQDSTQQERCLTLIVKHLNSRKLQLRMIPYTVTSRTNWQQFMAWHSKEDSWQELPIMMGQTELSTWRAEFCNKKFHARFDDKTVIFHLPGTQVLCDYKNSLYLDITDALVSNTHLRLPAPLMPLQRVTGQFWYDQYTIGTGNVHHGTPTTCTDDTQNPLSLPVPEAPPTSPLTQLEQQFAGINLGDTARAETSDKEKTPSENGSKSKKGKKK